MLHRIKQLGPVALIIAAVVLLGDGPPDLSEGAQPS